MKPEKQPRIKQHINIKNENEKGVIIVAVTVLIAMLALVATVAVLTTSTDIKISGNYKTSVQAFSSAQAGREEARARLRASAGPNLISDTTPELAADYSGDTSWRAFIGTSANAQAKGYDPATYPNDLHKLYSSMLTDMDYTVVIKHATDASNIEYWGDDNGDGVNTRHTDINNGKNIYVATSYGVSAGSNKTVEIEISKLPPPNTPSPLYLEAQTDIRGASTYIIGNDACGSDDKPGIATTQADGSVDVTKPENIIGTPGSIGYNQGTLDIDWYFDYFKGLANFSYDVTDIGGSGNYNLSDNWGTPTGGTQGLSATPSSCSDNNIIYIDTTGMTGDQVKFAGDEAGCGILLVDGNLAVNGGFSWYGFIIVNGNIKLSGGGSDKLITGAVITSGNADTADIGGNVTILYCSQALTAQVESQPMLLLTWRELF